MAEVFPADFAGILAVDGGVSVECPLRIFASKRVLADVSACRVDADFVFHTRPMYSNPLGFATIIFTRIKWASTGDL